jgi:uncharacterized coiled-coil protein SlyX
MTLTLEEIQAIIAENGQLRTEVAQLKSQLEAALARIAELEHQEKKPPPFVKRNRPPRTDPPKPRKKRAST